jgi:hypothetical protein
MPAIVSVSGGAAQFSFVGNWKGPAVGQTEHTLRRADLPSGTNTIAEAEAYINNTWLPQQLRDEQGKRTGYGRVKISAVSPSDWSLMLTISDSPLS